MSLDTTRHRLAAAGVVLATIAMTESFPAKADTVYKTVGNWQIDYDQQSNSSGCFMLGNYKSGITLIIGAYFQSVDNNWIAIALYKDNWNIPRAISGA